MSKRIRPAVSRPLIVGIGGTTLPGSSTEQALKLALSSSENAGARTLLFDGSSLTCLPHFGTDKSQSSDEGHRLVDAVREADGLIIGSPGYHGSISGLVKNAIDYLEFTAKDERPYLDGVPVGLISTAYGWQATASTLAALRSIVHALRGWPTPLGASVNSAGGIFLDGRCTDVSVSNQLDIVGKQVVEFARQRLVSFQHDTATTSFPAWTGFQSG
ncbi:NADPH-dependent FMN reductase [Parasphingorhabdus sp.]|uniref:NADPH-dependent FMN reductase n=1 Tax=Parasphingorhabdus sp. TaxID=2709688 RepID=UPI003A8CC396